MRDHLDLVFIIALILFTSIGGGAWIYQQNQERIERDVSACQRGNVLREYAEADNDDRITRIETRLSSTVDPPAPAERDELVEELRRRMEYRPDLGPIDCDRLR